MLTALALRTAEKETLRDEALKGIRWTGDWCLIAQDDQSIFNSRKLAIIHFKPGTISIPLAHHPGKITRENINGHFLFTDWKWENGMLRLNISQILFEHTGGFLVESK